MNNRTIILLIIGIVMGTSLGTLIMTFGENIKKPVLEINAHYLISKNGEDLENPFIKPENLDTVTITNLRGNYVQYVVHGTVKSTNIYYFHNVAKLLQE